MGKKPAPKMGNRPAHRSGPSKPRAPPKQQPQPANKQPPKAADETAAQQSSSRDPAHQQKLLDIFRDALAPILSSATLNATLQEVKTALYNRDFDAAFGREDYLDAYAARWSPTRALCYDAVLRGIASHLDELSLPPPSPPPSTTGADSPHEQHGGDDDEDDDAPAPPHRVLRVLALGGAAAELVALGSHLGRARPDEDAGGAVSASVALVDAAPWARVVAGLRAALSAPPALPAHASAAARARARPLVGADRLRDVAFARADVLALDRAGLAALVGGRGRPVLVTLLFTLNELFAGGGVGRTTAFLLRLTSVLPRGSLLLVVDSPGSYSEAAVGREARRYPMQWLLDRILLRAGDDAGEEEEEDGPAWVKVEERESVWFRLGQGLRYPIPLEDMRYQMHLYRRGGDVGDGVGSGEHDGLE